MYRFCLSVLRAWSETGESAGSSYPSSGGVAEEKFWRERRSVKLPESLPTFLAYRKLHRLELQGSRERCAAPCAHLYSDDVALYYDYGYVVAVCLSLRR